jgi:hypothetical protein
MEKTNVLQLLAESKCDSTEELAKRIMVFTFVDKDLFEFIYYQAKALFFIMQGISNPTDKEMAMMMSNTTITMAINIEGAVHAYQHFLDGGVEAMLADINRALEFSDKNVG